VLWGLIVDRLAMMDNRVLASAVCHHSVLCLCRSSDGLALCGL